MFSRHLSRAGPVVCSRLMRKVRPLSTTACRRDSASWKDIQEKTLDASLKPSSSRRGYSLASPQLSDPAILDVQVQGRWVHIMKDDRTKLVYPSVWLRDNCQCSKCFHPVSKARLLLMRDLDVNVTPKHTEVGERGRTVNIVWSDEHQSHFDLEWLEQRAFTTSAQEKRTNFHRMKRQLWGAEIAKNVPTFEFSQLVASDLALYQWLVELERFGFVKITNAPLEEGSIQKICERVAFPRLTHYGIYPDVEFRVQNKNDPSNLTYTEAELGLHTDLPQYDYMPGIQFLHTIKAHPGKGGGNEFVDGFLVAQQLKKRFPDFYDLLRTEMVDFSDEGIDATAFFKVNRAPVIMTDLNGDIIRINYNNQVRDSYLNCTPENVYSFYEALKEFNNICYDPDNYVTTKFSDGEIVAFDNLRVLHGRIGFTSTETGERHLQGGYLDWDEAQSTMRVLHQTLVNGGNPSGKLK